MRRLACLLALILLAGCGAKQARYTGTMTPEGTPEGTPGGTCGTAGRATLTVRDGHATFTPNDGALLVPGSVAADGTLAARLDIAGSDHKPYPMTVEGHVTEDVATGLYVTPRCRFSLLLTRVRIGVLGESEQ